MIDLGIGQTQNIYFPSSEFRSSSNNVIKSYNNHAFQYIPEAGLSELRESISNWIDKKTRSSIRKKDILITNGASHALELIIKMLVPCGGTVVIEDPTYFFALEIIKDWNINIIPVKTNCDGIDTNELERVCFSTKVDLLYIIPFNHNPTGVTISEKKVKKLRTMSEDHDFYIASDEVYQFVGYPQPKSLYDPNHSKILSIGSFSKILGPGLRLGWITGASYNIRQLQECGVLVSGGGVSSVMSLITSQIINCGKIDKIIDKLNDVYDKRREVFNRVITEEIPSDVKFQPPTGGFFGWIELGKDYDIEMLIMSLKNKGVGVMVGSKCSFERKYNNCLRLGFTYYPVKDIEFACKQICKTLFEQKQASLKKRGRDE